MSRVWTQVRPNCWRFVDADAAPASHSALPFPHVISDEMPAAEQVDGKFYTSKSQFRAVGRALGLTEVGNEKPKPRVRNLDTPENQRRRSDAVDRAFAQYQAGRRPTRVETPA